MSKKKVKKGKVTKVEVKDLYPAPETIRIGYQDYTLNLSNYSFETHGMYGEFDKYRHVITVNKLGNDVEVANTLIHEILHAVFHTQSIKAEAEVEEEIVNSLANGLTQVFRDNPQTVFYILSKMGYE